MNILVTGAAGFIGFHLIKRLLNEGHSVFGLDNLNSYYNPKLKKDRLDELGIKIVKEESRSSNKNQTFHFLKADISNTEIIEKLFDQQNFEVVINLAAQAGVRHSLDNPHAYTSSNIEGFLNILEGCRSHPVKHLIYASSSSVYGDNEEVPFKTSQQLDRPVSLYAATKKANELMAYTYSHLYKIATTGLRFFTVYGPWGRPDMAYFKFAERMVSGKPIDIYNNGDMSRDFTYIDDIVESIVRLIPKPPEGKNPNQLFNIGYGSPVNLMRFIEILEQHLEIEAKKNYLPMQPGDVPRTWADTSDLQKWIDYQPRVSLNEGIREFVEWYKNYKS